MGYNYESDIETIKSLENNIKGEISLNNNSIPASIVFNENNYILFINDIIDMNDDKYHFEFTLPKLKLIGTGFITGFDYERRSKCDISSFHTNTWTTDASFYKSYSPVGKNYHLSTFLGRLHNLQLLIKDIPITLSQFDNYILISNNVPINYDLFSELRYYLLVALGFISGYFIQDKVYIFQCSAIDQEGYESYKYEKLRPAFSSIYHAISSPFGYKYVLGNDIVKEINDSGIQCYIDTNSLSKLTELIMKNRQIQYALVLFNEANGNRMSLLIKNNCFCIVLEVLRKFFHEQFKDKLSNHTSKNVVEKFTSVLDNIFKLTEDEILTIKKRNNFMHGDVSNIDDQEMVIIMQKQITLIHKIILIYIDYKGYVIDQYALRNNQPSAAFVKLS